MTDASSPILSCAAPESVMWSTLCPPPPMPNRNTSRPAPPIALGSSPMPRITPLPAKPMMTSCPSDPTSVCVPSLPTVSVRYPPRGLRARPSALVTGPIDHDTPTLQPLQRRRGLVVHHPAIDHKAAGDRSAICPQKPPGQTAPVAVARNARMPHNQNRPIGKGGHRRGGMGKIQLCAVDREIRPHRHSIRPDDLRTHPTRTKPWVAASFVGQQRPRSEPHGQRPATAQRPAPSHQPRPDRRQRLSSAGNPQPAACHRRSGSAPGSPRFRPCHPMHWPSAYHL